MDSTKQPRLHLEEYKLKQDPQDYGIADEPWDLEKFKKQFKIVVVRYVLNFDYYFFYCIILIFCFQQGRHGIGIRYNRLLSVDSKRIPSPDD